MMYRCRECDAEFDEYTCVPFRAKDFELERYEGQMACPHCGSIEISKLYSCEFCDKEWTEGHLCSQCTAMAEDIIKYAKDKYGINAGDIEYLIGTYREDSRWTN